MDWVKLVQELLPILMSVIVQIQHQRTDLPGHEKKNLVLQEAATRVSTSTLPPAQQVQAMKVLDTSIDAMVAVQHDEGWQTPQR